MEWCSPTRRILRELAAIRENQEKMMSDAAAANAALTAAVADLKTEVADIATEMDANFAALQAALAGGDTSAVTAATADIRASIDALKAAGARDAAPAP